MFKLISWTCVSLIIVGALFITINHPSTPTLILNMRNQASLPLHFRMSTTPLPENETQAPSSLGLAELEASGSAQFSVKSLGVILKKIGRLPLTLVDLRQESHGFLNGMAISWYAERDWANKGKTLAQIEDDETSRLHHLFDHYFEWVYFSKKFPLPIYIKSVDTENELAQINGIGYLRIPVTDHLRPSDEDVDHFISFIKELHPHTWLHFHCAGGEGRTTTFLIMYDMIRNATKVSFHDILERQNLLGGANFLAVPDKKNWKYEYIIERYDFLSDFYNYSKQNSNLKKSWKEWTENKNKEIDQ